MSSFKNNQRRNRFRSNSDRNFKKRNGNGHKLNIDFNNNSEFKRKNPGRNNQNAAKLIEKYNDLAREALSNGDKILSENYLQHADHFQRIQNEREVFRRDKNFSEKSENNSDVVEENIENSNQNSDKDLSDSSIEKPEVQKSAKSQVEVN